MASLERSPDRAVSDPADLREIGDRLFDQGFDPGKAGTPATAAAIRGFEDRAGLPQLGRPTARLLDALRATKPPSPWGRSPSGLGRGATA